MRAGAREAAAGRARAIASSSVGQVLEQERNAGVHVVALDQVVVLEHEHESLVERGELVDQRGQHDLDRIGPADAERGERRRADSGRDAAQRLDHIRPETDGVVVGAVDREPREPRVSLRVRPPTRRAACVLPQPAGASSSVRRRAPDDEPLDELAREEPGVGRRVGAFSFVPRRTPAGSETGRASCAPSARPWGPTAVSDSNGAPPGGSEAA